MDELRNVKGAGLPKVKFGEYSVTRLMIGGNPFSGFSHQTKEVDEEMVSFYTAQRIKEAWDEARRCGINGFCMRTDRHILRVLREYADEGKAEGMIWFAQTAPELANFEANVRTALNLANLRPTGIYHHGGQLDSMWDEGRKDELRDRLKLIRDLGVMVGVASHRPEIIAEIEDEGWDIDFYMACFYNLTGRGKRGLTAEGDSQGERFDPEDPPLMCRVIRQLSRPCIAYKILGAGRLSKTRDDLVRAFRFAFDNIKEGDAVVVGVFQKYSNQIREDVAAALEVLCGRGESS